MKIKTKEVQSLVNVLEEIVDEYNENKTSKKRDWRTYEQQLSNRIKTAMRNLEPLIIEAISQLKIIKAENRGRNPILTLKQKVELLLLKHLFARSNREMSDMLVAFTFLSGIDVSYKTIERLYSDEQVILVLLNIQALILKRKGVVNPDCSGDGTGYSLTVKKHYATEAKKLKEKSNKASGKFEKVIFSFRLIDLDTRMYIGYGTSFKSEKEAFVRAMEMSQGIGMKSIRLDRYYAAQAYVKYIEKLFGKDIMIYVIFQVGM